MTRFRQTLLVLLLTILSGAMVAQNNTNSPYTRYGYGQLADQGSGNSKAMGGIAYGLRDRYQTNFANPASYTAVDSLTFMFDGGISMQNTNFSNGAVKKNAKNSSFDYITMQFRLSKWGAMSIGLLPYSNVGYSMYESGETEDGTPYVNTFSGEGGLHQLYLGAGFKILKNLSIGANISYLWGDMSRSRYQSFSSNSDIMPLTTIYGTEVTSYKLDFGAQYTQQFGKKHSATVGVVFSPGHDLGNDSYVQQQLGNSTTGYSTSQRDTTMTMGIPMTLGAGVTYVYDDRLTVGVDVMFQKWNSVTFMNEPDAFCNRAKIALGAEYIPNLMGRSYLAHIKYRLGAYYSQPYYKIDGVRAANEYGVTAGFGLPLPRSRSVLSISAQYVRTQGKEAQFLNENTLRLCIGVTFNERWFWKRKVE
ncbi:hypothetical protein AALN73_15190 [Bacteroides stercorirosoris]|jgi:hypothetical protein|uniref:Outer membrane protein n=1 Tax=Bacteroides stercorirosoris TaxID=871324 RepID=A0A1M6JLL6_9BACE|nr:hypothetical protein [Bacteroides stercorirosoris]RGX75454.1 hypothetical protein DXA68_21460 [Bacteroides stercorirosoris]SHJ47591.1 hypothetical protein SAMN05444350_13041 [Bacteroides stercorirosoris]